ncbi:hypothetical protein Poly51_00010 [Rubripirellula tenax]|uniref:Uncharacterized protein n=1 Tax=Rubripirellula tenax TaxID=2528015 RepID=A0A5C6FI75_9BACT|nr:hypothetical protein [Rubripirellula tenax]TWU59729.1 hypothetical protein Poly51_00010 [Rubripirellula tenax]
MNQFWPYDLNLDDTSSPHEILCDAKEEWAEQSGGLLDLVIQEAESTSGHDMLIVHAKHVPSNRTVTLFSVVHRSDTPYPARIQPRDDELPDLFKKSYYRPGIGDMSAALGGVAGRQVENKWVCDTPAEFRSKLSKVFDLGVLKSEVLSLMAGKDTSEENAAKGETQIDNASSDEDQTAE